MDLILWRTMLLKYIVAYLLHARTDEPRGLCNPILGIGWVTTIPRNDVTSQQSLTITSLVFLCGLGYPTVELFFLLFPWRSYVIRDPFQLRTVQESFCWVTKFQGEWTRNGKKTSWWFEMLLSASKSFSRRRLVKSENPSARATVNCKYCKSSIALY
jgi:hypothetical protein